MAFGFQKGSRISLIAGFLFLCVAIVTVRLFQLQILDHNHYVLMAHAEHIKRLTIPAHRGQIFSLDRGVPTPLVMNTSVYTVFVDPHIIAGARNADAVERTIREIAGGNLTTDLSAAIARTQSRYQIVATRLSRTQAELIKEANLSGVGFHEHTRRVYIEDTLASQTLGFVNFDGIGQYGVEAAFEERLRGRDGLLQTVTDVAHVPLTIGDNNIMQPAVHGDDIVLTLDRNIQAYTERALQNGLDRVGANRGSVIVMDPATGHVLAMANYPTYNAAEFYRVTDPTLFHNPILAHPFYPGSTIKPFTIAVGLDRGVITPQTTYINTDRVIIDTLPVANSPMAWGRHQGPTTMQTALDWSLNTGMINIAQRLDGGTTTTSISRASRDIIHDYFVNRFNFGRTTGFELYEAPGFVQPPDFPHAPGHLYAGMTFGQNMTPTMIQVATGFSALINGGYHRNPTIFAGVMERDNFIPEPARAPRRVISESTSDQIRQMLITSRRGVFGHRDHQGFLIGGKTGTSETLNPDGTMNLDVTIATYLGFGGNSSQKYVIMVRVQGDDMYLEGAVAAEPIFADISNWLLRYLNLRPGG